MEKLIELANQYEIEKEKSEGVNVDAYVEFKWDYNHNRLVRYDETDHWEGDNLYGDTAVAYLISKSFGMIKWLVENDKIYLDAQAIQYAKSDLSKFFAEWKDKNGMSDDYAMLLMLLAIQDEPINFLISILKNV